MTGGHAWPSSAFVRFWRASAVSGLGSAGVLADSWGMRPTLLLAAAVFALVAVGLAATPFRHVRASL